MHLPNRPRRLIAAVGCLTVALVLSTLLVSPAVAATACPAPAQGPPAFQTICIYGEGGHTWGDGHNEFFVVGLNFEVWHSWEHRDGTWNSWTSLGGQVRSGVHVDSTDANHPLLKVLGTNLGEFCTRYTGSAWPPFTACGGTNICPTTIGSGSFVCDYFQRRYTAWPDHHDEWFVVGTDFAVWHNWQHPDGTWDGWTSLGGAVRSGIDLPIGDPAFPTLHVLGTNLLDYCKYWTGSSWSPQWTLC